MKTEKSSKLKTSKNNSKLEPPVKNSGHSKKILIAVVVLILFGLLLAGGFYMKKTISTAHAKITLPEPIYKSATSIEEALQHRRSIREYKDEPITLQQITQLVWAAQGITSKDGYRTAPSAGALYPLDLYVVCGNVSGLDAGVYHYLPSEHALELLIADDKRADLTKTISDSAVTNAPAYIVITGLFKKTTAKYGARGQRYVYLEAGHVAENIYIQAVSLQLGTVSIGAFKDADVTKILQITNQADPLYIMPVGKIK